MAGAARRSGSEDRSSASDLHRSGPPRLRGDEETLKALIALIVILWGAPPAPAAHPRQVAFTFDDLPGLQSSGCSVKKLETLNRDLVRAIKRNHIPATGVVVESRLCGDPKPLARLFEIWLDAGLDLGNHTASHRDFNKTDLEAFERDTIMGEATLRPLLEARGRKLRYFRFPFLRTGTDLAKKRAFEKFLAGRGYTNAVVTIDNDDYIYAGAYVRALERGDRALAKKLAGDYIPYMERMFAFYEKVSMETLGYEVPQVLLLHDSRLNADHLDSLAAMARRRGYSFVSLEEALRDPAYRRNDAYIGARGLSWLLRWALDDGKNPPAQPEVPAWVMDAFRKR